MESMISIHELRKLYGRFPALNGVNLELSGSRIIGLCGPNGAGKTTLIKILTGMIRDYNGLVSVKGEPLSPKSRTFISYLPDTSRLAKEATGLSMARYYKDIYPDFDMGVMEDLFGKMNLDYRKPVGKMSKGMVEKFQLILTMSRKADIYLFDEPIAGVDPAARDLILETILSEYRKDSLVIISTHLIRDVEEILDEVIFINEGEILLHRNCDELRAEKGISIDELFREEYRCF